jgi:hypothetical protein
MGALRKQMDADMVVRGMSQRTRESYLAAVAAWSSCNIAVSGLRIPTQVEREFRRIVNDDPTMLNAVSGGC